MTEENQDLYQAISNADRAIEISSDVGCVLPPGYRMLRVEGRTGLLDGYEIALLNDLEMTVVYYNQVTLKEGTATQKAWRSPNAQHATVIADITDKVFFDYLLQRQSILVSDHQVTGEGSHHWKRQLSHALQRGMKVFLCGPERQLQKIENQTELNELVDRIWSPQQSENSNLALITKAE